MTKMILAVAAFCACVALGSEDAGAACLEKKVARGASDNPAHLILLVVAADEAQYRSKGFTAVQCPDSYLRGVEVIDGGCNVLGAWPADRKNQFEGFFGVTLDEVCQAARTYYAEAR